MDTKKGKVPRVKKRATYETNVVISCRDKYNEKLTELNSEIEEITAKLSVIMEKGKLSSDRTEQETLAREVIKLRDHLQILKEDKDCFQDNVDMFDELIILLKSFFVHERYKYIIRKIPEKKLPNMVKDPNKREELNGLLLSLLEEFNKTMQKNLLLKKDRKQKRSHLQKAKDNFLERNDKPDKEINSVLEEFNVENKNSNESTKRQKINN